jgi:replicative DNA helicase
MPAVSGAARGATADWRGGYADDFGVVMPDTEMSASELAGRLLRLAAEIEAAITAAATENKHRADLRSQYDWERTHPRGPR